MDNNQTQAIWYQNGINLIKNVVNLANDKLFSKLMSREKTNLVIEPRSTLSFLLVGYQIFPVTQRELSSLPSHHRFHYHCLYKKITIMYVRYIGSIHKVPILFQIRSLYRKFYIFPSLRFYTQNCMKVWHYALNYRLSTIGNGSWHGDYLS